ncbi:hypothetical protein CCR85_14390 [Rhodothalassium salexigens]|nr:hypothetical protein [Rhodothalassium salexigens]MBK5920803.1 hypothetical protein [Rhodothalassium salexigens]
MTTGPGVPKLAEGVTGHGVSMTAQVAKPGATPTAATDAGARHAQAVADHKAGRRADAARIYEAMVADDPGDPRGWFGLGVVAAQDGRPADAILHFERAIAAGGLRAEHHHNLAGCKTALGRLAEAEAHYTEALRLNPGYCEAYFNYAQSRAFRTDGSRWAEAVEAQVKTPGLSAADRRFLHFAAGKFWHDADAPDRAWPHYQAGNALYPTRFDRDAWTRQGERTFSAFDAATLERLAGHGHYDAGLVFVVGMPRSGTSLIEQMLASHRRVTGLGERADIHAIAEELARRTGRPHPDYAAHLTPALVKGFGAAYAQTLRAAAPDAPVIVDKHPLNFRHVGLIRALLPRARIVWARRDPLDTCLSCFQQNFRSGQHYSFDLDDLALVYAWHERLMRHWTSVAGPIHRVDYACLVADPEATARALAGFIGLDWDPQMLAFHTTDRAVHTASRWQVRQPLYTSSAGRARRYARHLGPLVDALARHGVAVEAP